MDGVFAAHGLARFRAAQLQQVTARRLIAEIVIKSDDAVDVGVRQVQSFRDQRDGSLIDVSELFLQRVQNRQKSAGKLLQIPDSRKRAVGVPDGDGVHGKKDLQSARKGCGDTLVSQK